MKLKRLKVLLPALTGMILTNGPVNFISNNNVESIDRIINVDSLFNKKKVVKNYFSPELGGLWYSTEKESLPGGLLYFKMYYELNKTRNLDFLQIKFFGGENYIPYLYVYNEETKQITLTDKLEYDYVLSYTSFLNYFNGVLNIIYVNDDLDVNSGYFCSFTEEDIPLEIKRSINNFVDEPKIELINDLSLLKDNYYSEYDPNVNSYIQNYYGTVLIDENFSIRRFLLEEVYSYIQDCFTFSNNSKIVDIAYAYLYKSSDNDALPYSLFIKFLINDSYKFENALEVTFNCFNVFTIKQFKFKQNDVEIKEDDEIDFGYGKRVSDLFELYNPVNKLIFSRKGETVYLNIEIDGGRNDMFYSFVLSSDNPYILEEYPKFIDIINNIKGKSKVDISLSSGNESYRIYDLRTFYINWIDDIQPELSGEVTKFRTSNKDNFKYKELFKANDEKDGDVSESIELIEEEGKYFIKAKDAAGNESKKEILLDIDPILYENINVINDEKIQVPENILLTKKRFEKILTKIHGVEPQDVDIIPYVNNCKTKGTYKVSYKINEETKEMDFEVVDPIKKNPEPGDVADQINEVKVSFIAKVKTFFNKLGNWFRGVFTKWKFDCFITNEQWDTRFN